MLRLNSRNTILKPQHKWCNVQRAQNKINGQRQTRLVLVLPAFLKQKKQKTRPWKKKMSSRPLLAESQNAWVKLIVLLENQHETPLNDQRLNKIKNVV